MKEKVKNFFTILGAFFAALIILSVLVSIFSSAAFSFGNKVVVVEINGVITDSSEATKALRDYGSRSDVKAVVIRLDTPGGAVGSSQEIYTEVKRLREKKKVVVSMGDVAASGGYYIASAADKIVANPGTITGSIGVIIQFLNVEELLKKVGLKDYTVKSGKFKDAASPFKHLTEEERRLLQSMIDDVHGQFVDAVVEGRKLKKADVVKFADGRMMTGAEAKRRGLVDELGNMQDAVMLAAGLAGISGEPRVVYHKRKKGIIKELMEESVGGVFGDTGAGLKMLYLMPGVDKY